MAKVHYLYEQYYFLRKMFPFLKLGRGFCLLERPPPPRPSPLPTANGTNLKAKQALIGTGKCQSWKVRDKQMSMLET